MLLWYVWIRLVDGAWHRLDDIARQLKIPKNAVSWAARFLSNQGLVELRKGEEEVRLSRSVQRFEGLERSFLQNLRYLDSHSNLSAAEG